MLRRLYKYRGKREKYRTLRRKRGRAGVCGAEGTALARPVRELVGFAKTDTLQPGEDAALKIDVRLSDIARYDDTGVTGHRSCFVLDAGRYSFFVGTDVRDAAKVLEYEQTQTALVEQLSPIMQPSGGFARLTSNNGLPAYETVTPAECREGEPPADTPYTGDRGIKLADVYYGRSSLDDFAAQPGDFDMA